MSWQNIYQTAVSLLYGDHETAGLGNELSSNYSKGIGLHTFIKGPNREAPPLLSFQLQQGKIKGAFEFEKSVIY